MSDTEQAFYDRDTDMNLGDTAAICTGARHSSVTPADLPPKLQWWLHPRLPSCACLAHLASKALGQVRPTLAMFIIELGSCWVLSDDFLVHTFSIMKQIKEKFILRRKPIIFCEFIQHKKEEEYGSPCTLILTMTVCRGKCLSSFQDKFQKRKNTLILGGGNHTLNHVTWGWGRPVILHENLPVWPSRTMTLLGFVANLGGLSPQMLGLCSTDGTKSLPLEWQVTSWSYGRTGRCGG